MSDELMEPSEWLAEAQAIPVGTKNKVQHLCGDASLVVYHNVDSWTAWCWRCHTRGWVPKAQPNMRERLARKEQQRKIDNEISYTVRPPFPASHDLTTWTPAARLWLYKAGLTAASIARLGAYYHQPTGRVVLPCHDSNGKMVFWQARNAEYPSGGAKYISSPVPRDRVHVLYPRVDRSDESCGGELANASADAPVVLTEDILSAFKVAESGAGDGYAVMGTALGQHTVALLLRLGRPVLLWFDPDQAGTDACLSITKQLKLVGLEPTRITTDKDPKHYSFGEIRGIINGLRPHAVADHARAEEVLSTPADAQP
jgi:DNA primase